MQMSMENSFLWPEAKMLANIRYSYMGFIGIVQPKTLYSLLSLMSFKNPNLMIFSYMIFLISAFIHT